MAWPAGRKSSRVRTPTRTCTTDGHATLSLTSPPPSLSSPHDSSGAATCSAFADVERQQYKCRRVEHMTYAALRQELMAYMEAACEAHVRSIQQQQQQLQQHTRQHHDTRDDGNSSAMRSYFQQHNEDEEEYSAYTRTHHAVTATAIPAAAAVSVMHVGVLHAMALSRVCDALRDVHRVLRTCWTYRGNPQDAFEPCHTLAPLAQQLLLSYGRHTLTPDARYVVLCGGVEQLPWVACAMVVVHELLQRYQQLQQQQQAQQQQGHVTTQPQSPPLLLSHCTPHTVAGVHVVLLNCRSFGWLAHAGNDDYVMSGRLLRAVDAALTRHVAVVCRAASAQARRAHSPPQAPVTMTRAARAGSTPAPRHCRSCSADKDGDDDDGDDNDDAVAHHAHHAMTAALPRVLVLLGDAVVMDGGVPTLALSACSDTYLAHMAYGRGLASLVVRNVSLPQHPRHHHHCRFAAAAAAAHYDMDGDKDSDDASLSSSSSLLSSLSLPLPPPPPQRHLVSCHGGGGGVSCGERRADGIAAQAVLLDPLGPLVLHVQTTHTHVTNDSHSHGVVAPAVAAATAAAHHAWPSLSSQLPQVTQQQQSSGSAALSPALLDVAEWLLQMLQAPQPVLLVEWQLHDEQQDEQRRRQDSMTRTHDVQRRTAATTASSSRVLRLLASYDASVGGTRAGVRDAVAATLLALRALPLSHLHGSNSGDDGEDGAAAAAAALPLVFTRDCDVTLDNVQPIAHTRHRLLLTTLRVRPLV